MKTADRLILWFLILLGSTQVCAFGQSGCAQLVWSDEFDYSGAPDASKWGYDLGGGGWGNNEVQVYTDDLANASVDNGRLTIKAIKSGETWSSARLVTRNKGDWL